MATDKNTTGMKTRINDEINGSHERSLTILMRIRGGHPIGEVFLIINEIVSKNVSKTMFLSNLFETLRK